MLLELRLKKLRIKQQNKLDKTNFYLYKSITTYIQNSDLKTIEKEEALQQIIDMILQAQMEDKPIRLIIGDDYEKFCKSIIEEYTSTKGKTYIVLNYIQRYLIWSLIITAIFLLLNCITSNFTVIGITLDNLLVANVIALVILPASKKGRQEVSMIKSLYKRLYYMISRNRTWANAIFVMMLIFVIIRFLLSEIVSHDVLNLTIKPMEAIPYVFLILVFIVVIETYKMLYDRK